MTLSRICLAVLLGAATLWAQDAPMTPKADAQPKKAEAKPEAEKAEAKPEEKEASAPGKDVAKDGTKVVGSKKGDEVKVLKPTDVPAELSRLKSKADIKAEVTVLPSHGRPVVVKGIIRNGKLIERFRGRRFMSENSIENPRCGVRLWWVEGSAGWIFLRYSQIQSLALTGRLTAKERRAIMEALQARRKKPEAKKPVEAPKTVDLSKLTQAERETFLLRNYPKDKGWNHTRLRTLKRKEIIENKTLTREEAIFVRHFADLIKARLKELKEAPKKNEFEPGTDKSETDDKSGDKSGDADLPPVRKTDEDSK